MAQVPLPSGFAGFAGKNARGNDAATFRLGRGADFWFHVADYTGCHVVVRNPDRRESLPEAVGALRRLSVRRYGDTQVAFYLMAEAASQEQD